MGVDLRLLPFDGDHPRLAFSHTVLDCERRRELWDAIEKLPALATPPSFRSFCGHQPNGEHGYGETPETPYGDPLTYTTVSELLKVRGHEGVTDNFKNRAIWAYLSELQLDTKVALYWH